MKSTKPTKSAFDAARNPALVGAPKRTFKLSYFPMGNNGKPGLVRHYLRLDTAVPAALRMAITMGKLGDVVVISHSDFGFEIARIYLYTKHINIMWDDELLSFKLPKAKK